LGLLQRLNWDNTRFHLKEFLGLLRKRVFVVGKKRPLKRGPTERVPIKRGFGFGTGFG